MLILRYLRMSGTLKPAHPEVSKCGRVWEGSGCAVGPTQKHTLYKDSAYSGSSGQILEAWSCWPRTFSPLAFCPATPRLFRLCTSSLPTELKISGQHSALNGVERCLGSNPRYLSSFARTPTAAIPVPGGFYRLSSAVPFHRTPERNLSS